uniref:Transposase n=1 Tax=Ditylenchus dipsaci TaxID=166011 RepID=A0A915E512_9BILA
MNRRARLKFAKEHLAWTSANWAKVLWSDESKFNLFSSDGIRYVRRPPGKRYDVRYQMPTVKHSKSVMVWGCFSRDMIGPIARVEGLMNAPMYRDILENTMLPHAIEKMPAEWIFQQDNDPKNASNLLMGTKPMPGSQLPDGLKITMSTFCHGISESGLESN